MERVLKWVAAITAIISLIFAVQKSMQAIADNNDRSRRIEELTQIATRQQQSGDYALAWDGLAAANKLTDSGGTWARMFGTLDTDTLKIRLAREDLAMAWLDNISVPSGQTFASIVEKLLPTLEEGVLNAESKRKGDLLAHIGWGYFLRGRDGAQRIDPIPQYQQAIQADADNPYAHASWAHWLLWNGGAFEQADEHFAQALKANRVRERVRELQLSAYRNRGSNGEARYVAVVAEMIAAKEPVEQSAQRYALAHITRSCTQTGSQDLLNDLKSAVAKDRLDAVYRSMIAPPRDDAERALQSKCIAAIQS